MFLELTSMLKYGYDNFDYPYFHNLKKLTEDDYEANVYMFNTELIENDPKTMKMIELGKIMVPIKLFADIAIMSVPLGENAFNIRGGWDKTHYTTAVLEEVLEHHDDFAYLADHLRRYIVLYEYPDNPDDGETSFSIAVFPYNSRYDDIDDLDDIPYVSDKRNIPGIEARKEIKCYIIDALKWYLYNADRYDVHYIGWKNKSDELSLTTKLLEKVLHARAREYTGPDMINRLTVSGEEPCASYIMCVKSDLFKDTHLPYKLTGGHLDTNLYDPNTEGMLSFEEVRQWYN